LGRSETRGGFAVVQKAMAMIAEIEIYLQNPNAVTSPGADASLHHNPGTPLGHDQGPEGKNIKTRTLPQAKIPAALENENTSLRAGGASSR